MAEPPDDARPRAALAVPSRLAALRATELVDALPHRPSEALDRLTRAATRLLGVPIALVTLVDDEQQWLAGLTGLTGPLAASRRMPLSHSFCHHVVTRGAPLVVEDAATDPIAAGSPAGAELGVRAYLGVPLTTAEGETLGALCAIDHAPRAWTAADLEGLTDLAAGATAEIRLRERDARFRLAVEATQEVIYLHDYATGHVVREGAVEAVYGCSADALAATSEGWLARVYPEDRAHVAASWKAALARGTGRWTCEYRMQHPDGTLIVVRDRARIVSDARGQPLRVAGAVSDVTRQRAAEDALRASEARFRQLAERAPMGIFLADARGHVLYANPHLARLVGGLPAGEAPELAALVHPDDRARVAASYAAFLQDGHDAPWRESWRVARGVDGVRALVVEAVRVPKAAGAAPEVVGTVIDVTEERAAERALRASEARLRLATEVAQMMVWERDLTTDRMQHPALPARAPAPGRPTRREPAARGRPDELVSFEAFLATVHPEDRERVARANADALARRGEFETGYRVVQPDGAVRWHHTMGRVLDGADGRSARVVGATIDVTERVRLEAQLRQAQKMEAVGQLAGGIAHDFNNLLTVITGNLEFVVTDLPPEVADDHPVRRDLAEIGASAERARTLVRQLLAFSRKQPVHPRPVDVGALVRGAERLLRRVIGEEITLVVHVGDGERTVHADPGQLEQVLMNLAVNARDAMLTPLHGHPGTGGTLEIAVDAVHRRAADAGADDGDGAAAGHGAEAAAAWVRLRVRDTGHGMSPATQAHAFEPFFTTKEVGHGTGLGLATVFGIVSQAGGHLDVGSAPGAGTTITILLPTTAGAVAPVRPAPTAAAAPSADTPHAAPERERRLDARLDTRADTRDGDRPPATTAPAAILLVEDEAPVRAAVRRILERGGYVVHEAGHGADALVLWSAHHAHLVALVTDLRMPELGGRELAARLRAERPTLPVVFMSGYAEEGAEVASGPQQAFVEKPFTPEALLGVLRQLRAAAPADDAADTIARPR